MPHQSLTRFPLPRTPAHSGLDLINRATVLTCIAHDGQQRKDGLTPQALHGLAVQRLLMHAGVEDPVILAAGSLHDAIEDNPGERGIALRQALATHLGPQVLALVDELTDDTTPGTPRAERKARQMQRLQQAPDAVRLIKLADVVACAQEGPAPSWTVDDAARYVHQRRRLVREVLAPHSTLLVYEFSRALTHPQWHAALAVADSLGH